MRGLRLCVIEDDDDLEPVQPHPFLQLDQLELQVREFLDVFVVLGRLARLRPLGEMPVLLDGGDLPVMAQHRCFRLAVAMLDHGDAPSRSATRAQL